jgi:hypothetical protein
MSFFSRKQEVGLEDFCRDFYEKFIDASETFRNSVIEAEDDFSTIDYKKFDTEIVFLRFELFALPWTHKFISGKIVVAQSAFTKSYLQEKGRNDIWNGMKHYNESIGDATLNWLSNLGKINVVFNYNMRKDLTAKNIKDAKELGINIDDSIERVNERVWSEMAWKQRIILEYLVLIFYDRLGLNPNELNKGAGFRLAGLFRGMYEGAQQSLNKIKIKV